MSEHASVDRFKQEARELIDRLKQERDELRLQSHLFKAELRDEWEEVESKWRYLEHRLETLAEDAKESAGEIGGAIRQVGDEIAEAYRRMRKDTK